MVLLVSANPEISAVSSSIAELTDEEVEVVGSLARATARLRRQDFSLVVVDQGMAEAGTAEADTLLKHVQSAAVIFVNFAIAGVDRIRAEVQLAFRRRQAETFAARDAARTALCSEIGELLAGIILISELAQNQERLTPQLQHNFEQISRLATEIQERIERPPQSSKPSDQTPLQPLSN